ncbi:hypothetical protein D3C86_1957600 [compost metagenome]
MPEIEDLQSQFGQALGVSGPVAAFAFGQGRQGGAVAGQRGFSVEDAAVQAGQEDVLDQRLDPAQLAMQQAQFGQPRQLAAEELGRLGQLLQQ